MALSLSPDEQNLRLLELIRKHTPLIPTLPVSPKKPWISPSTLEYITSFQSRTDLTSAEVKQYRNKIKKLARKDKKQFIMTTSGKISMALPYNNGTQRAPYAKIFAPHPLTSLIQKEN